MTDAESPEPDEDTEPKPETGAEDKDREETPDREKDEDEDVRSAQDRAADPESARQWGQFASQMDTAMKAMFGLGAGGLAAGGTANFFLGDTAVGQVGDRGWRQSADIRVRSGAVAGDVLEQITRSYVEPDGYPELKRLLDQQQLLFLQARGGTGRTTTALHLLHRVCRQGVHKLDPDVRLKSLPATVFEPAHGYLLESLDPVQAGELKAFHADRLGQLLRDKGCMMVVIVDEATRLPMNEIGELVVTDFARVRPDRLLRRYVEWGLSESGAEADREVLSRPEVKEIVTQLTEDVPARELAKLGELLVEVANERLSLAAVRDRYSKASEASFGEWFDTQAEIEQRAFVIALAVFNDEPVQLVSAAATMLADRFRKLRIPRWGDRARDVFAVPLARRVELARAELVSSTQETGFGQVHVRKLRFRDDRFPQLVLEQVRTQYTEALDVVLDWLFDLGGIPGPQVRIRAGVAAGLLSQHDFVYVFNRIIVRWAGSGDVDERRAAVAALQVPGRLPGFDRVVAKLLRDWVRPSSAPALRATAAQALGTTTSMSAAAALRHLRQAARHADWAIAYCVGESVSDLFVRVEPEQVLAALVRWTREGEFPERRETALLAALITSCYVYVTVDRSSERWPALIWLAENHAELREHVVVLFSRMLVAADFMRRGYLEIKRWVRIARREPTMAEPLGRLLREIGEHSGELDSIDFYLRKWAGDREGPIAAARTVLTHFEKKEESS